MSYELQNLTDTSWVPDELKGKIVDHNQAVGALLKKKADLASLASELLEQDLFAIEPAALVSTRDKQVTDSLALLKAEARAAKGCGELIDQVLPLAQAEDQRCFEAVQTAIGKGVHKLTKAGMTVETMQAWPNNPETAQRQLEHQARLLPEYKAAELAKQEQTELVRSLGQQRRQCQEAIEELQAQAKQIMQANLRPVAIGG